MRRQELLKGLTEEQIAKVTACKNQEELLKIAKEEGIELTDDQLEAVSGGMCTNIPKCKICNSNDNVDEDYYGGSYHYHCKTCDYYWMERFK